jgi:methylated-DNA-[protein]-cysteine S-methyltransferase
MNMLENGTRMQRRVFKDSPVGPLTLISEEGKLRDVQFGLELAGDSRDRASASMCPVLRQAERELAEYFEGKRRDFSLSLTWRGTSFQNRVWKVLCEIPFGSTCSYSDLARRIGSPQSARAVGVALGRNPIVILVPCHRVIGADGSLVGFGGGLEIKRKLLEHEAQYR